MEKSKGSIFWTILWLLVFFPVGLYRMWSKGQFNKTGRVLITLSVVVSNLVALFMTKDMIIEITNEVKAEIEKA